MDFGDFEIAIERTSHERTDGASSHGMPPHEKKGCRKLDPIEAGTCRQVLASKRMPRSRNADDDRP